MKLLNEPSSTRGIFLSGGRSARMGVAKQWLTFANVPLLLHTYDRLRAVCEDVVVLTNDPQDAERCRDFGLRTLCDLYPGQGPLAGLHAGLQGLEPEHVAVLIGCDLPFMRAEILRELAEQLLADPSLDAVVPYEEGGHLYPVCAVYRARVREAAEACLARGENAMRRFLQRLHVQYIPTERWSRWTPDPFFNMNTPADYELACTLWEREGAEHHD